MTPLEALALKRIRELETLAKERYGVTLTCGFEQEAYLRDRFDQPITPEDFRNTLLAEYSPRQLPIKHEVGLRQIEFLIEPEAAVPKYLGDDATLWQQPQRYANQPAAWQQALPSSMAAAVDPARRQVSEYMAEEHGAFTKFWPQEPSRPRDTSSLQVNLGLYAQDRFDQPYLAELAHHSVAALQELFPITVTSEASLHRHQAAQERNEHFKRRIPRAGPTHRQASTPAAPTAWCMRIWTISNSACPARTPTRTSPP